MLGMEKEGFYSVEEALSRCGNRRLIDRRTALSTLFRASVFVVSSLAANAFCQQALLDTIPQNLQLFPRLADDSCTVIVSGAVIGSGYDSATLLLYRDGEPLLSIAQALVYENDTASFRLAVRMPAERAEYGLDLHVDGDLLAHRDSIVCGDVFLINGQSNAQAPFARSGRVASANDEWIRTFGAGSQTIYSYDSLVGIDTAWYLADKSPEGWPGHWGMRLGELIVEKHGVPVCILNQAIGSWIEVHLPGAMTDIDDRMFLGTIYGRLLYRAAKSGVG
ncbi:MAG: hypothetical protein GF418_07970, partial [Chitinivibrionales bacterium]|nr:hypothetical protein [Chitinivibrionales bacterium]MBD3395549.1 hypothetical protein [Chitinivibrionales bacterium]